MTNSGVLVAMRSGVSGWLVDGRLFPQEQLELVTLAEDLAIQNGGPRIRTVVFVSAEETHPRTLTRSPRHVCQLSRIEAIAHSAPEHWTKFLVFDADEGKHAAVVVRSEGSLSVLDIQQGFAAVELTAISLGIRHCLWAGSITDTAASETLVGVLEVKRIDATQGILSGAADYAASLFASEGGVSFGRALKTSIRSHRTTDYSVHRPLSGVFDVHDKTLADVVGNGPAFTVVDRRVAHLYGRQLNAYAAQHLNLLGELQIDATESCKTLQAAADICEAALEAGLPRNGVVVAVGGGVTLDIAGFAASIFRRGVGYVRVPTTLVGLADVAVGIKQGVNSWKKKNILGSFYAPIASVNDYRLLATLPAREVACGMAEIIKMALLRDAGLFEVIDANAEQFLSSRFQSPSDLTEDVAIRAELLMMEQLAPNLFESDLARLVDFGHTFSPSIESRSGYAIPHGAAVALDIMLSVSVAVHRGLADLSFLHRVVQLFGRLGLGQERRMCTATGMWAALDNVRQHRGGSLNLVIVSAPGRPAFVNDLRRSELEAAVRTLRQESLISTPHRFPRRLDLVRVAV